MNPLIKKKYRNLFIIMMSAFTLIATFLMCLMGVIAKDLKTPDLLYGAFLLFVCGFAIGICALAIVINEMD